MIISGIGSGFFLPGIYAQRRIVSFIIVNFQPSMVQLFACHCSSRFQDFPNSKILPLSVLCRVCFQGNARQFQQTCAVRR